MSLRLTCPSCGAEHTLHNPGITVLVCDNCDTTLYREEGILRAGEKSIVGEPSSNLAIGSTGQVGDRQVTLLGRIQFQGATSTWDEWFGTDEKGREVWLTEDEKNYTLERALPQPLPGSSPDMSIGAELSLAGRRYQVDERGEARCLGGEGQLPRPIRPGEQYRFIDATEINGSTQLTVEFSPDSPAGVAFVGRDIPADQVVYAPQPGAEFSTPIEQAATLRCANCGGSIPLPAQDKPALTVGCPFCDSVLHLEGDQAKVAAKNAKKTLFPFEIGDRAALQGQTWEVIGRLMYRIGRWQTREYLLWSDKGGYRWLEESDRHYTLMKPTSVGPSLAEVQSLYKKRKIDIGGTTFQFFEDGRATLAYVDGALPWQANVGESNQYYDFIAPPRAYSMEVTGNSELERFVGDYIPPLEVFKAFGKEDLYLRPAEAGAAQPNPVGNARKLTALLGGIFCLVNLNLAMLTMGSGDLLVDISASDFSSEIETEPFTIEEDTEVIGLHITTNTDNSWVYVTTELVDVDSEVSVGAVGSEVSYYHGVEGGESWTEGSRSNSRYLKAPPPGQYQLIAELEGDRTVPVSIQVTAGDRLTRYPMILALLMALVPIGVFMQWRRFEKDRWDEED
ncbi:MAG: ribosomal protein S27E [Myxococcota bacterium]|jgi:ribosomal protein S27E